MKLFPLVRSLALIPLLACWVGAADSQSDTVKKKLEAEKKTEAEKKKRDNKEWFRKMDTGPIHSATITAQWPDKNIAMKGVAVNLGAKFGVEGLQAGVCFDTDLLRYSAGWTGGFLDLRGVAYDGGHGESGPKVAGKQFFGTKVAPAKTPLAAKTIQYFYYGLVSGAT